MSVTIYRIQDKDGRGPYKPGFSSRWVDEARDMSGFKPFYEEFGLGVLGQVIVGQAVGSGFRSMDQLKTWFSSDELARLKEYGYQVVSMEVERILAESEKQLVFVRNSPLREDVVEVAR